MLVAPNKEMSKKLADIIYLCFTNVQTATSLQTALELHEKEAFDLIYIDLPSYDIGVLELIQTIQSHHKNQKFILLITKECENSIFNFIKIGITHFIAKPLDDEIFAQTSLSRIEEIFYENQLIQSQNDSQKLEAVDISPEAFSFFVHQAYQPLSAISSIVGTMRARIDLDIYINKENPYKSLEEDLDDAFSNVEELVKKLSKYINDFRNFHMPRNKTAQSKTIEEANDDK